MASKSANALVQPLGAVCNGLNKDFGGTERVLRIALLSMSRINEKGSMTAYSELLRQSLQDHIPWLDVCLVGLRDQPVRPLPSSARHWSAIREIRRARSIAAQTKADVYHVLDGSYGFMSWGVPLARTLVTVHDLIPALQSEGRFAVARPGWGARWLIRSSLRFAQQAALVCSDSAATAQDLFHLTGRPADAVVHLALRPMPRPMAGGAPIRLGESVILHVGNNGFYKNRSGAVRVFAQMARFRRGMSLILAGAGPDAALLDLVEQLGIKEHVHFIVEPDDAMLATLYAHASLLLFPSLYEGFGWPPLEAMSFGCPVVCSNAGSLPEVVGNAAVIGDPGDIPGFAAAALRVLEDEALARSLIARGRHHIERFTSQRMAEQYATLYRKIAAMSAGEPGRAD